MVDIKCPKCDGDLRKFEKDSFRCEECGTYFGLYDSKEIDELKAQKTTTKK